MSCESGGEERGVAAFLLVILLLLSLSYWFGAFMICVSFWSPRLIRSPGQAPWLPEFLAGVVLLRYRGERHPGERFGDFCARVIWQEPSAAGNA